MVTMKNILMKVQKALLQADVQSKSDKSHVTVADYGSQAVVSVVLQKELGSASFSFVAEEERYEEILREKIESQTNIDQSKAYYEVAGGAKKKRIVGLGSEGKNYYKSNNFVSCGSNASLSVLLLVSQQATTNKSEFVTQLIPALIDHFLSVVFERVHEVISSPPTDNPSGVTHVVPPASTNVEEDDPLVSDADHSLDQACIRF